MEEQGNLFQRIPIGQPDNQIGQLHWKIGESIPFGAIPLRLKVPTHEVNEKLPNGITYFGVSKDNGFSSEDYFAVSSSGNFAALVDGTSSGNFSKDWGACLAEAFITHGLTNDLLPNARELFREWFNGEYMPYFDRINRQNPGYREERAGIIRTVKEEGGSTTFLGLQINQGNNTLRLYSVGDTYAILIKPDDRISIFPASKLFTDKPETLHSINGAGNEMPKIITRQMLYEPGDILLMATDALAEALIDPKNRVVVNQLIQLPPDESGKRQFDEIIKDGRRRDLLKRDDTTLVVYKL